MNWCPPWRLSVTPGAALVTIRAVSVSDVAGGGDQAANPE
jgi:hypothetical protein